nr:MAG TPA: head to tail adaptor [Caudoviricetes sp.]
MSAPLVDIEDIEAALGRPLRDEEKPRALFVADKLSAAFRMRARQTFAVETYVHRLKVDTGGRVFPTRAPLVEVLAVFTDEGAPVAYEKRHGHIYVRAWCSEFVVVTYEAGLSEVPAAVRLQLADSVRRILLIPDAAAQGATQMTETTGPFTQSRQYATWAVGGQAILSPDDQALADAYRPRRAGHVWVMGGA